MMAVGIQRTNSLEVVLQAIVCRLRCKDFIGCYNFGLLVIN
jgi:hypothetical protein